MLRPYDGIRLSENGAGLEFNVSFVNAEFTAEAQRTRRKIIV